MRTTRDALSWLGGVVGTEFERRVGRRARVRRLRLCCRWPSCSGTARRTGAASRKRRRPSSSWAPSSWSSAHAVVVVVFGAVVVVVGRCRRGRLRRRRSGGGRRGRAGGRVRVGRAEHRAEEQLGRAADLLDDRGEVLHAWELHDDVAALGPDVRARETEPVRTCLHDARRRSAAVPAVAFWAGWKTTERPPSRSRPSLGDHPAAMTPPSAPKQTRHTRTTLTSKLRLNGCRLRSHCRPDGSHPRRHLDRASCRLREAAPSTGRGRRRRRGRRDSRPSNGALPARSVGAVDRFVDSLGHRRAKRPR